MKMFAGAAFAVLVVAACDGDRDTRTARGAGELLPPTDSVVLQESDSALVGRVSSVTPGPGGTLFVSDGMNGVVHQFQGDGRYIRRFGRKGAGPGEFGVPFVAGVMHDTLLIVTDNSEGRASVFSLPTGRFVSSTRHTGFPISMAVRGDTAYMGVVHFDRKTSLAKWTIGASEVEYFAPVPSEYAESFEAMVSMVSVVTLLTDTIVYGVSAQPGLFLARRDGSVFDTITIPAVARRGVPADIVQRFAKRMEEPEAIASILVAVHRLSDGRLAVVYQDFAQEGGEPSWATYLSIVSADFQRACADLFLHAGPGGRPVIGFAGDTLLTLITRLRANDDAENVVFRYDLAGLDCVWRPIR